MAGGGAAWADAPARPAILFNRWQEDWSVLADPATPRQPLDDLKYIPLSEGDYLSLGANLRERFESNDAPGFGLQAGAQDYVISRLETHADLRLGGVQAFMQLESAFAPGKASPSPVDQDRLDVEQAFVAWVAPLGEGTFRLRAGRQQFAFDLQRFVSARDGPNVRQSYDALWGNYEWRDWRFIAFFSQPVVNRDRGIFDDTSSPHLTYGGVRAEYKLTDVSSITAYLSQFHEADARFITVSGNERRDIADIRYAGAGSGLDWDVEAMGQGGRIAAQSVRAWAFGARGGYTFDAVWQPRLGLQMDAASGDSNPRDHVLGTFNPLFPNGYYVTLAGYTGYTNLIHLKPSLTVKPSADFTAMIAVAAQWRQSVADAVYTQPDIAVPGTAGHGGAYTGRYGQLRLDYRLSPQVTTALEAVHFQAGGAIRQAGGHDSNYLGLEVKLGW